MKAKKLFLIILLIAAVTGQFVGLRASLAADNAGAFLRNGIGARALGMGGAFVAVGNTAESAYWNPASLGFAQKLYLDTMYADKFKLGVEYSYVGVGMPIKWGGFGINYIQQGVKDIEKSTTLDVNNRPVIEGKFDNSEQAILISYAKTLNPRISVGVNVKYISHKLDTNNASGLGTDIGLLWRGQADEGKPAADFLKNLSLGMAIQDLGKTRVRWNTGHIDTIPTTLKLGAAYTFNVNRLICDNVIVAVDIDKRENRDTTSNEGIEVNFLKTLALRAGLRDKALCFGGSISFKFLKLDYAFTTHTLGDTQWFSIGGKF